MRPDRPDPAPARPARWPWATTTVAAAPAAGTLPWWRAVEVPRADLPEDLARSGSGVPVSGPASRDADGDGTPETLIVSTPGGISLWTDLDGDGLADRVLRIAPSPDPVDGLLAAVADEGWRW